MFAMRMHAKADSVGRQPSSEFCWLLVCRRNARDIPMQKLLRLQEKDKEREDQVSGTEAQAVPRCFAVMLCKSGC